jgi:hypothetical protein
VVGKKPNGRPRQKGAKLPSPQEVVARSPRCRHNVAWYGGGRRDVEVVSGVGHWYQGGAGLVAVRWVFVHDKSGTHRDEYFYTTDLTLTPPEVIAHYAARWNIETTFAEMRAYLGLETTRGLRVVHGGGTAVRAVAGGGASGVGSGVAGQSDGDVLRRPHRRTALAVDELGFCHGRS